MGQLFPIGPEFHTERPLETLTSFCGGTGVGLFGRAGAVVQPDIDSRSHPGVRFIQDVQVAVSVQVGQFALVPSVALDQLSLLEVSLAVTIQNPRRSARIIGLVWSV